MMMACWFTIACCCWAKTAFWASGGERMRNTVNRTQGWEIMFDVFFFSYFSSHLMNQVLQVLLQQQEATSRLPQEGPSQLWTHANTHIHQFPVSFSLCLLNLPMIDCVKMLKFFQCEYLWVCVSVCLCLCLTSRWRWGTR